MIGNIIRESRKLKKMTLAQVAESIDVTVGYLSNLEKNRQEPSLSVLRSLSETLEIHLPLLLCKDRTEEAIVVRKNENAHVKFHNLNGECKVLTPMDWRSKNPSDLQVIELEVPAYMPLSTEEIITETDECLYIVEGELEYHNGHHKQRLGQGQSLFIPRHTGHIIVNPTGKCSKVIWMTPR